MKNLRERFSVETVHHKGYILPAIRQYHFCGIVQQIRDRLLPYREELMDALLCTEKFVPFPCAVEPATVFEYNSLQQRPLASVRDEQEPPDYLLITTKPKSSAMQRIFVMITALGLLVFASCKHKTNKLDTVAGMTEAAEKITTETQKANDRWEERRAKGDTTAIPYKELQNYLPDVSGYAKEGDPQGSQMDMPGLGSWSQTEQRYKSGDKNIKVSIVDYNAAHGAFAGATAIYKMGYSMEDDSKRQGTVDIGMKDVVAYETVYKQEPRAELTLIVGDRFLVQIESEGSNDPDLVRSVAKSLRLGDLASK